MEGCIEDDAADMREDAVLSAGVNTDDFLAPLLFQPVLSRHLCIGVAHQLHMLARSDPRERAVIGPQGSH